MINKVLTVMSVSGLNPKPSCNNAWMYDRSRHINGVALLKLSHAVT